MLDKTVQGNRQRRSLKLWASCFDAIHHKSGIRKDRILTTLEWFCKNINGQFTPKATSAATFRDKFHQIEAAMKRQSEMGDADSHDVEKWKKEAEQLAIEAGELVWPDNEKKDELSFIQISLNNYQRFLDDLHDHVVKLRRIAQDARSRKRRSKSRPDAQNAPESVLERHTPAEWTAKMAETEFFWRQIPADPYDFVMSWVQRIHRFAHSVEDWDGRLLSRVWQRKHRWVHNDFQRILQSWDCDAKAYDRLLKEIEEFKE